MLNSSRVSQFILLGFTNNRQFEILLFFLLFGIYFLTVTGNILILAITLLSHQLYTPMYFFLRHLASVGTSYCTTIIPQMLANLATGRRTISLCACFTQTFLYFALGTTAFLLLAVMSVDRYVAICNPFHYSTIMNGRVCSVLITVSWLGGILLTLGPAAVLFQMPFCGPNIIDHFFCDSGPLVKLACADTALLELANFLVATYSLVGTLVINIVFYVKIISTVMSIPPDTGRKKAFSTCASHLTVVSITYGSCIFMYIKPQGKNEFGSSKVVAILNTIVVPLLLPFIYCLRNKQFQFAWRTVLRQCVVFWKNGKGLKCLSTK